MRIGFSGTRVGMSEKQRGSLREFFEECGGLGEVHHGDCVGADAEFAGIARDYGFSVVSHPPTNGSLRAFCSFDAERTPLPYLDRNKRIVEETDLLIAAPETNEEKIRSGTWSTVRYARKLGKRVVVLER